MPELPASARLALWATSHLAGRVDHATALARSAPDADHTAGAGPWLDTWRSLGERVALMALPRPGDYGDLPRGDDLRDAAISAGECVYVPGLGGGLVPMTQEYGPSGDRGLSITWEHHDSDPVATHVLDAWSIRETERDLARLVREATAALEQGPAPWATRGLADDASARLDTRRWGLPSGLHPRAARVLTLAETVGELGRLGQSAPQDGTSAAGIDARLRLLRELTAGADRALARAVNIAALHLAGLRPGRDD